MRYLPFLIQLALLVYCLIDCLQTDSSLVRNLPKPAWVLLIVILPVVGGIAWLVAGRPERTSRGRQVAWPSTATAGFPEYERPRPLAPDDDPEFLASVRASDVSHERMLRDWEADLRAREQRLGETGQDGGAGAPGATDAPGGPGAPEGPPTQAGEPDVPPGRP